MSKKTLYVVIGLGQTGLSCVKFLVAKGLPVAVTDSRENPPEKEAMKNFPHVEMALGGFSKDLLKRATHLILSPGVSKHEPEIAEALASGTPCVGDIELFLQQISAPIIGITGSNGKSTTTSLVGDMAKQAGINVCVAGNIGLPVLDTLQNITADLYVLELSSYQLESTYSLKTKCATILNISQNHLDHHASMDEYAAAKTKIYENCEVAVVNRDEPSYMNKNAHPKRVITFGLNPATEGHYGLIEKEGETFLAKGKKALLNVKELKIQGRHNTANALAAMALADGVLIPVEAMLKTLRTFAGLRHRCQFIRERNGVTWYNDSKSTTVVSTLAAVNGLGPQIKGKIILIAGGLGKGADFSPFAEPFKKYVSRVVLIGKDADKIEKGIQGAVPVHHETNFLEAIQKADALSTPGDIVLLSPACASWDMFKSFEDRGDQFIEIVNRL